MEKFEAEDVPFRSEIFNIAAKADHSPLLDNVVGNGETTVDLEDLSQASRANEMSIFSKNGIGGIDIFREEEPLLVLRCSSSVKESSGRTSMSSENEVFVNNSENEIDVVETGTVTGKEIITAAVDNNVKNRISMFHCYICGKNYTEPKLLNCLHTFCLECLEGLVFYKDRQKIECVVCGQRTQIPPDGMGSLPTNVVIKNLLAYKLVEKERAVCDICVLHGQENEVAGLCIDCNDLLCSECREKHTYSRQTVNHTVQSLEEILHNEEGVRKLRENLTKSCLTKSCPQHNDEKLKFYCVACQMTVCRDCVLVAHSLHQVLISEKVMQNMKDDIDKKLDQLNVCKKSKYEELEKYEDALQEEEKRNNQTLETAYKEIIAAIEEKYKLCLEDLSAQYSDLREKCKWKRKKLEKMKEYVEDTETSVRYLMDHGLDLELRSLQTVIQKQLDKLQKDLQYLGLPQFNISSELPSVNIYGDNCMTLKRMSLFQTARGSNTYDPSKARSYAERKIKPSNTLANCLDRQPRVSMKPAGMRQEPRQPSLLGEYSPSIPSGDVHPFGFTAKCLPRQFSNAEPLTQNMPSISLAQSFKSKMARISQERNMIKAANPPLNQNSHYDNRHPRNQNASHTKDTSAMKIPRTIGVHGESLVLKTTLSVKVLQDQYEPYIVGMTCLGVQDFAVCDVRNRNIKIFSICGKFLNFIVDYEPMTVTFCNGHLVWNGNTAKILAMPTDRANAKIHKKRFQPDVAHPVTTFQEDRYLVANVRGKIAAFLVDGKCCN